MRHPRGLPEPAPWRVLGRTLRWGRVAAHVGLLLLQDRLAGRYSERQLGVRLKQLFIEVGGTAVKVGQQLAMRADMLPQPVCEELQSLSDRVPPMPTELAFAQIVAGLGRPIEQVFRSLDPKPIGAASVACVYKGVLHDGRVVAVKVQRPGVAMQFAEDLAAFRWATRLAEAGTLVREGFFSNLREDLGMMFGEEMDFVTEARYQRLFRRSVKGTGMPWISAPAVVSELCSRRVLVSEFAKGLPAADLLEWVEDGSPQALARVAVHQVDPAIIARRMLRFSLWVRYEAPFFHADPHPGNVFVQPDNQLVLLDFGACGMTSRLTRLRQLHMLSLMIEGDASAMSKVSMADLQPLPRMDRGRFLNNMVESVQRFNLALADNNAHWSERTVGGLYLQILEVAREYQLQVNLDTIRSIRSFLLYDTLAFRLDSTIPLDETHVYLSEAAQRGQKRVFKQLGKLSDKDQRSLVLANQADVLGRAEELVDQLEPALQAAEATVRALVNQATLASRFVVRGALAVVWTALLWNIALAAGVSPEALGEALLQASPLLFVLGSLVLLLLTRRALRSLDRVDAR